MGERETRAKHRRWADVAVIIVGVITMIFAWWFPPLMTVEDTGEAVRYQGAWYWVYAAAGPLAIGSVFVALKSQTLARLMVGAAGLILLIGLFVFSRLGALSILTLAVPGLILLGASFVMGPMPTPEQEGKSRSPT